MPTEQPGRPPEPRCAALSLARGDDPAGTAAPVTRWLLLEQPGPWGRDALLMSRLARGVATTVHARAREAGVRVMLLRRPGRSPATGPRRFGWAESTPGREALRWGTFDDDADLLDLPFDGSAGDPGVAGEAMGDVAFLVCTHARHDACCAIRGRPVAAALAARRPEATWECSHTGGDRFAANVVVLPHGLYYGTVTPDRVGELVAAQAAGIVLPDLLRGRSAFSGPAQAAQAFARTLTGDPGIAALRPGRVDPDGPGRWRVVLDRPDGDLAVVVEARRSAPVEHLTCAATRAAPVLEFVLVSTTDLEGDPPA